MYENELLMLISDLGMLMIFTIWIIALLIGYHKRHKMISKLDNYFDYLSTLRQLDHEREIAKYEYKKEKLDLRLNYKFKIKEIKTFKIKI